jgi:glycosyltransferase involved in cell wall biosynthesis
VTLDGADVSLFTPQACPASKRAALRRSAGAGPKHKLVMFHGTVEAHHGQKLVIELIARAWAAAPQLRFLVIAGGPGFLALKAALDALPNVRCLSFQPPAGVARYAAAADAGMIPYEPSFGLDLVFTLKLLEYFALGLPVVCFRLASAEAVFKNSRRLLTAQTADEFVALLSKAVRLKKSAALRRRIVSDFSWEKVCSRMIAELEKTAGLKA